MNFEAEIEFWFQWKSFSATLNGNLIVLMFTMDPPFLT